MDACCPANDICLDAFSNLCPKVPRIIPRHVPEMFGVEMQVADFVRLAAPNHLLTQATCKPSLEIDALALACEIGYDKLGGSNSRQDLIRNTPICFGLVNSMRLETHFTNSWSKSMLERGIQSWIEPHRYEASSRHDAPERGRF
jgi:hypothetical protein